MKPLLSIKQLAQLLGVAESTLYEWCANREIPHLKVGARTFFSPEKLEQWLTEREIQEKGGRG